MKDGVRIAVVGTGAIAQLTHIPVLSKLRGAKLVALCDNDAAKARALADRFDVPDVFTDFEELLDSDELDAVVIATPNHLHEPHVLSALRAKLHVLCERPLSLSTRGIERCLAAAQKADRRLVAMVSGLLSFLVTVGHDAGGGGQASATLRWECRVDFASALAAVRASNFSASRELQLEAATRATIYLHFVSAIFR